MHGQNHFKFTLMCVKETNMTTARGLPAKTDTTLNSILVNRHVFCLHPTARLNDTTLYVLLTCHTDRVSGHKQRWVTFPFSVT